jgi:AraC-like DNA-binding protein
VDSNILVIGNQTTVFIGSLPDIGEHAHAAAVIALSLNGEEIGVRYLPNRDWQDQQAYFTHAETRNEMRQYGYDLACIAIEPDSHFHQQYVKKYGFHENRLFIFDADLERLRSVLRQFSNEPIDPDSLCLEVVNAVLGDEFSTSNSIDPRVELCVERIKTNLGENISASELAEEVKLTERQLSTLFRQDLGVPVRKYRLWLRLKSVVRLVNDGVNLTDAALDSGFTDSAHFSNSFRKLLGLAPTDFLASAKSLMLFASSDYV